MQDGLLSVVGDLQGIGEEAVPALEAVAALPGAENRGRDPVSEERLLERNLPV